MGSRAVVVACRDEETARRRFGASSGTGVVHTRTGRPFFPDRSLNTTLVAKVSAAASSAGLFDELGTDWLLLDAELLPWSAKAGPLIREQYASVGAASRAALPPVLATLEKAGERGLDVADLAERLGGRLTNAERFTDAYRRYTWPTDGLAGVRLAPFQLLASEGANHVSRDHGWHLDAADRLTAADPALFATTRRVVVDLGDAAAVDGAVRWWTDLTATGSEGMVVKPHAGLVRSAKGGLVQPGLKCRGPEYLRLIYGPDYLAPAQLTRLRDRGLGRKRSLASREYALGLAALDRVAAGEPLWRVHEAVFAILACESEPVDPRL